MKGIIYRRPRLAIFLRECIECQMFTGRQKLLPLPLNPIIAKSPFQQLGLDSIGEIHPPSSGK